MNFSKVIRALLKHVPDKAARAKVYEVLIDEMYDDQEEFQDLLGIDGTFDATLDAFEAGSGPADDDEGQ